MKTKITLLIFAFSISILSLSLANEKLSLGGSNWYLCAHCCKTKQADSSPNESGCRVSSSGQHNYQFCGKSGSYNMTCRNCDASVSLASGTTPNASKCCETGGTHSWYNR